MFIYICNNSTILSVFRVVRILIRLITIAVPLILIISSMLVLVKEISSADNDLLSKALKSFVTKLIAAILIIMIPTFVNILANVSNFSEDYASCIKNATSEGISIAKENEAVSLVETANKTLTNSDYQVALSFVNKLKDSSVKTSLLNKLNVIKEKIELQDEINKLINNASEEDYNRLLNKTNALEDSDFKKNLLSKLEQMKKNIDEKSLANVEKVLSNISPNYPPKKYSKNVTINYYVANNGQGFTYWLYIPDNMKSNLPIIFFMHDLGCRGDDYHNGTDASIWGGPMREVIKGYKKWDAIIVHAQVPSGEYSQGYRYSYVELLNKLASLFKADTKKISVMGFSNGCYGVWAIVGEYQNYFSAAVPIGCSSEGKSPNIFKTTPMWSLVGSGDGASSLPGFAASVNAINGKSKHSNSKYKSHNCLYPAEKEGVLLEYDVVEWMIAQRRSD